MSVIASGHEDILTSEKTWAGIKTRPGRKTWKSISHPEMLRETFKIKKQNQELISFISDYVVLF